MTTYKWLADEDGYNVELIIHYPEDNPQMRCEVDDCVQFGTVLITKKFGGSYSIVACYPHIRYGLEDIMWHSRENTERGINKTIEELKDKIDNERKLGFEYD